MRDLRSDLQEIYAYALDFVSPQRVIPQQLSLRGGVLKVGDLEYDLSSYARVLVYGAGKASAAMAQALENLLGDRIAGGLIITKYGHGLELEKIEVTLAAHPVPDEQGLLNTERMVKELSATSSRDLVIFLLSGGASALLVQPVAGVALGDKMIMTRLLLQSGADIGEINTLRQYLSQVKGGKLGECILPADCLTLIISDVMGDKVEIIGSGPTKKQEVNLEECQRIIGKYDLQSKLTPALNQAFFSQPQQGFSFSPDYEQKIVNQIILNNRLILQAAADKARELGYQPLLLSAEIGGETREIAKMHVAIARECQMSCQPVQPPACLISGGETTVTIHGQGLGGRNQEFALAALLEIQEQSGVLACSLGTDGTDGPTEAAGGLADSRVWFEARQEGLDPEAFLADNDAYHFLNQTGGLIVTGPTGNNVMDCRIILVCSNNC